MDAWWPVPLAHGSRAPHYMNGIGRLKAGVTPEQAAADLNRIGADLERERPAGAWKMSVVQLRQEIVGRAERMLLVLMGAVGFVLLIACVNVAGLLLVRATARSHDLAVRSALGASRGRLILQSLCESVVLGLTAAVFGQLLAIGAVKLLAGTVLSALPRAQMVRLDWGMFAFTIALSLGTALLFGLVPALAGTRGDLNNALRESGRSGTASGARVRVRNAFVIGEIALASTLLVGAGLFLRTFENLLRVDAGFSKEKVITAQIVLPQSRYGKDLVRAKFFRDYMDRLDHLPGVRAAGASSDVPWTGYDENSGFIVEGRPLAPDDEPHARYHSATIGYFRAMGIPLLRGRWFAESDDSNAPYVIIINQAMAQKFWPGQDAIGKRIAFTETPKEKDWFTVVGIVGDVKDSPSSKAAEPAFWWTQDQQTFNDMLIAVRAEGDPKLLLNAMRAELSQLDPEMPLANIRTMEQIAGTSRSGPRLLLLLTAIFSALAVGLAAIGTYGVISYSVAQRTHEFGLRIALGAKSSDLVWLVGGHALRLGIAGVLIGVAMSAALARLVENFLYGVSAFDPVTFLGVAVVGLAIAAIAGAVPAFRATGVDPMISLRAE